MSTAWWAIILAAVGTYTMRAAFLVAAPRMADLPGSVQRVLRQIPPAALAAIVVPELLRPNGELDFWSPELGAGLLAAVVFWRTKSTALTLVVGMAALVILRHL